MLNFLLGLIPSAFTALGQITSAISDAKIAQINATTTQAQIAAAERVNTLQAQRDLMIADGAHSNLDIYIRSLIAIGPACYLTKIFLWDKVMQAWTAGTTDSLDPNLWTVVMTVLGFYFLSVTGITIAKVLKA